MSLNRIVVSDQVDLRLRNIKANTGLTPNLACRLGFCLSLAEAGVPDASLYVGGVGREFNRYTLTGQWDALFLSMLRERMVEDGFDPEADLEAQFKAHLSRGVVLLFQRLKSVGDLATLLEEAQAKTQVYVEAPAQGAELEEADLESSQVLASAHSLRVLAEE